jgi:hypothetical protein
MHCLSSTSSATATFLEVVRSVHSRNQQQRQRQCGDQQENHNPVLVVLRHPLFVRVLEEEKYYMSKRTGDQYMFVISLRYY